MGHLVTLVEAAAKGDWYFSDARWTSEGGCYKFDWPSAEFPTHVGIHFEDAPPAVKVEIRKWVESTLSGTVIVDRLDKSYTRNSDDWNKSYRVSNHWMRYHFEDEESAVMFRLRFSQYIKPITDEHPEWP